MSKARSESLCIMKRRTRFITRT